MAAAAASIKRVTLELGGKSPAIVFPDADIEASLEWLFFGFAWNAGQICSATARLLIHESVADEVVSRLVAAHRLVLFDFYDFVLGSAARRRPGAERAKATNAENRERY